MSRALALGLLLAAAGALALRLPLLERRPMHNDEAINAFKLQGLWERGDYRYDPDEFHGPTLYYCSLPSVWLSGAPEFDRLSERTLRLVTVAFGAGLVLLLWLVRDGLGWTGTLGAAGLTALSPAMVFYSRYFIHEMLLVFFTMLLLAGAWRYSRSPRAGWAVLAGAALGLMSATKETFVLAVAAAVGSAGLLLAWQSWPGRSLRGSDRSDRSGGSDRSAWQAQVKPAHLAAGLGVAVVLAGLFFSSFFTNPRGPLDAVLTYLPWLERAGGHSAHIHPWSFYLERLLWFQPARSPVWTEGVILLLAGIGAVAGFVGRDLGGAQPGFVRFLTGYTVLLTTAYSAIPYKTPWCMVGFLHGMILLAGVGAVVLVRAARPRPLRVTAALAVTGAAAHLGWEAWRASLSPAFASGPCNPYTYAQTVPNILKLVERVKGIASVSPEGRQTLIKVAAPESDYWPLPWYLRQFKRVWWTTAPAEKLPGADGPEAAYAPIMIVSAAFQAELDEATNKRWLSVGFYEMRPRVFFELYVEFELWKQFVATLPRPKEE